MSNWTVGLDWWADFTLGTGKSSSVTDTHTGSLQLKLTSGYAAKAANVQMQGSAGQQSTPTRIELVPDPTNVSTSYTILTGTITQTQNAPDPDGIANQAWTLSDTDIATASRVQRNLTVANDSLTRVASVFILKAQTAPTAFPAIQVGLTGGTTAVSSLAIIDPQTGELIRTTTTVNWLVEDAGLFWRVDAAITNNSTGNTVMFHVLYPCYATSLSATSVVSATGSNVFAWPNIQVASFATPPVLAVGTQTGNIASLTGLGSLTSGVSGLAVLNVSDPGSSGLALFSLDDGTANNQLALTYSAGRLVLSLLSGGVSQAAVDIGEWRIGRYAVAFSAGPNYVNGQVVRGDTATADTVATYPSISAVGLGGLTGTSTGRASVLVEKLGLKYGAGSTQAFASAYSSAVLAHGAVPALWDNFDRADGAIGTAASGQTWQQISGFVSASISSKALVALDSGGATTAAYNTIDLGSAPSSMKSRIFFGAGTTGGGVAMIAMPTYQSNSNTPITTSSIHIVFANDHVDIGIWQSAVYTVVKTITYPVAMKQDGTIYEVSWSISGNTLTVAVPGIIAPYSVTDSRFVTLTGRYVTFEHFWNSGQCHPSFTYVEARP